MSRIPIYFLALFTHLQFERTSFFPMLIITPKESYKSRWDTVNTIN